MNANTRFAAMGLYAGMLQTSKVKINRACPGRNWDYVPIWEFKFRRYHFNTAEQVQQPPVVQPPVVQNVPIQSPILVQEEDSPDDDCLLIEPEQNSFDESDYESDSSDLREATEGVHSLNEIIRDVCTNLHCINLNMSAQCSDPVHTTNT